MTRPRLFAIADLHLAQEPNREALGRIRRYPGDWLLVAGDVSESVERVEQAWEILTARFARVIWAPGNHELWTSANGNGTDRGQAKYEAMVACCRRCGVLTPEDPYPTWTTDPEITIAPVFVLYDYTFAPDGVLPDQAVAWARETRVVCADEVMLDPTPHASRASWCATRIRYTEERLAALGERTRTILVSHFPLKREHAILPRIPRFSIWCGTRRTEDWHRRFRAVAVVYGHLHLRSTRLLDGVKFEEVSLGYARQWDQSHGIDAYLRQIL